MMFGVIGKNRGTERQSFGQVLLEFTFSMIIVALMIFAIIYILRWTGVDLAERRISHEELLTTNPIVESYPQSDPGLGPLKQIDPYFYEPIKMNAVWNGT